MKPIARKDIMKVSPYVPGRPIDDVKREFKLRDVIKLASNENAYRPSPKVLKAISAAARGINRYPDGNCYYVRRALARRLGVSESQLIFGNGSDEVIVLVARAFLEKGDEAIIARPSFLIYEIVATVSGAAIKAVPLKGFRYDLVGMRRAVTKKTKVIFIGNPDNPAGTYISKEDLSQFLRRIRKDIVILIDEAYFEYVTDRDYPDTIALLKRYKNIVVTRTFSKMYGLAGLRIGYGIAEQGIIDALNRVREPFNVNTLAQAAALACLADRSYYKKVAQKIAGQRRYLYRSLKKLGVRYVETVTNFVLVDLGRNSSRVARALLKKGVIVRDMSPWKLPTFIRVSIGTSSENKRFIAALKGAL